MGQNCIGIERIIVHVDQFDDLFAIFEESVSRMRVGSVMSVGQAGYVSTVEGGSMICGDRFRAIERLIEEAADAGARVVGGHEYKHPIHDEGYYFQPTVVAHINDASQTEIAQNECRGHSFSITIIIEIEILVFAPVALIMPYESIEEAIEIANGTRYGLGASVFGPDQEDCIKIANQLHSGMVSVNDFAVFYVSSRCSPLR
jgi:acyl-CoA reductase-like NAD-dependent aldehyde dehydrogenase